MVQKVVGHVRGRMAGVHDRHPQAEIFRQRLCRPVRHPPQAGQPAMPMGLVIAAIARAASAAVVTRDYRGFEGCGLTMTNPWEIVT